MGDLKDIYTDGDHFVLTNLNNNFVYEVIVFCRAKGYFAIMDREFYSSEKPIPNIVEHFYRDAHSEIVCTLLSAPLTWLLENDYIKYVKPDKKTIIKTAKKHGKPKTTIGKQRSWRLDGQTNSS